MLSLWFMVCACLNAWASDRNFKRGNHVFGSLCTVVAAVCLGLWAREFFA